MTLQELTDGLTAVIFRLAVYANNNLIDDPAMLAFIFC